MAGLLKEIWINQILEPKDQKHTWMDAIGEDLSLAVENDTINLAEAGVDPEVLVNNTTYPIDIVERADVHHALPLDYFDTKNTVVRNAVQKQLSYAKMESAIRRHRAALKNSQGQKASHAITPSSDDTFTPVIPTTGSDDGNGIKMMTEDDIWLLSERFDDIDAPDDDRILVLHSKQWNHVVKTSPTLKEQRKLAATGVIPRTFLELADFKIYKFRSGAIFNRSTGVKVAYGAAPVPATDTISSFAFVGGEVMKAKGSTDMYSRLKDPEARGDIIGFQQFFLSMPMRAKFIGAIYGAAV
ncbi:MAG: hypothetical protein AAF587_29605 [Bacteroidota bacterium]